MRLLAPSLVLVSSLLALPGVAQRTSRVPVPAAEPTGVQRLVLPADPGDGFAVELRVGGATRRLVLERHSLRAADARVRVYVEDERGARFEERAAPPVRTYRGSVEGDPASVVLASFTGRGFQAEVLTGTGPGWSVEPVLGGHRVAPRDHDHALEAPCGVVDGAVPQGHGATQRVPGPVPTGGHCTLQLAQIAFDADYEYYQLHGSSTAAVIAQIEAHMNLVEYFYARDVLITYAITGYVIRTAPFYTPTTGGELLDQFRAEWNANQGSIPYDIGHLMTAKPGGVIQYGGLAWVGVVCTSSAYGWSLDSANIIGHEVGHNWGAGHCHDQSPCNNMCGACLYVAPNTKRIIERHRDSRNCLTEVGGYTTPVPPYAHPDEMTASKAELDTLAPLRFDVLRNDHDGNCDDLWLVDFERTSARGARISRSSLSGPRQRDELVYRFPDTPWVGPDTFTYTVMDSSGLTTTGTATLDLRSTELEGYWKLDDGAGRTITDSSGNGFDAEAQQGAAWVGGQYDGALRFNGTSQVLVTDAADFPAPWSVSAWVSRKSTRGFGSALAESSDGSLRTEQRGTTQLVGVTRYGVTDAHFGYQLPLDTFTHLVFVGRKNATDLYVNGAFEASVPVGIRAPMAPAASGGDPLRADLDELRVHRDALTPAEIADLYLRGGRAVAPAPLDGGRLGVETSPLTWQPALEASSYDVYLGTDWRAVRDADPGSPEYAGNALVPEWSPTAALLAATPYFWRVDARVGPDVVPGNLWQFDLADRWRWALDETSGTTAAQETGGNAGTYVGGVTLGEPGATPSTGTSIRLDGANDRVQIPALDLDSNQVTLTAWIRRDGAQPDFAGLIFSRAGSTTAGLNLSTGNQLGYHWNNSGSTWSWNTALVVPDQTWVFVALVVAPGKATIYLGDGGVLTSAENAVSHSPEEFDGALQIGRDPAGARFFGGWMDDVRVYAAALTPSEISALYD